jgi:hypothetical protein
MRTTLHTESNRNVQLNFRLATTQRTHSPNMPMITSRHKTSFCLPKSSRPLPRRTFANYCPTRTKLASPWMTPTKHSSPSTEWSRTNASPPSISMLWIPIRIKKPQCQIPMWLLSDHNNNNNNSGPSNQGKTTQEIVPEDKAPTEAIPTTDQHRIKAPTQHEMVNSASTAKY